MITAIKIIFLLGLLILIHETGHYAVARLCNIQVNEFSLGFGPKIWSKTKNETIYELRLIPLGGFVNLEGEQELSGERSFKNASVLKRIAILSAGALVNIIFGMVLFFIVIAIKYYIAIDNNLILALKYGMVATIELFLTSVQGIISLFGGKLTLNDMTGPVGISSIVSQTNGIIEFLYIVSVISVSLGITNLLPIIPLDGGKIILVLIEAIRKKPFKDETEAKINSIGFALLLIFSIMVTCNDITRLIQ